MGVFQEADNKAIAEDSYFIQEKLNHRPRKKLGYRTPYEVFYGFFALKP
jgi:IS30 family transposase